jgi:ParB family chromosome partitioning protein
MAKTPVKSPILGAVTSMIAEESERMVTSSSRFRHTFEVEVARCTPDLRQARRVFNEAEIAQLAATMASEGQLQPILVQRHIADQRTIWIIVAGERRWRAAMLNGWSTMLAIEHQGDTGVIALIENLQRVDLSAVEEARGLQRLIADRNWPQEKAAQALGKSKADISATLRILSLPAAFLEKVLTSELVLPKSTLIELARVEEGPARDQLIAMGSQGQLTIRALREARPERSEKATPERAPLAKIPAVIRHLERLKQADMSLSEADQAMLRDLRDAADALLGG